MISWYDPYRDGIACPARAALTGSPLRTVARSAVGPDRGGGTLACTSSSPGAAGRAAAGETVRRPRPRHRRDRRVGRAARTPPTSTPRSAAARAAFPAWSARRAGRALGGAHPAGGPARRARRRAGAHRVAADRQADPALHRLRRARHGRQRRVLRRGRPQPRGQGGRRVLRRPHLLRPARGHRRRRLGRAVELPAADGRVEDPPGGRRRQHHRAQAGRADAADRAAVRRGRAPRPGCPTAWSTSSPARARSRARR